MANILYRLINPPVRWLLRSPFHRVMSGNTLLLEFRGRKSGRPLSTPISYHEADGVAHCFTSKQFGWWRNLREGRSVHVTVKGKRWQAQPTLETTDHQVMQAALDAFLRAVPRDAPHSGVSMNNGLPDSSDIQRVVPDMVYLQFLLERDDG